MVNIVVHQTGEVTGDKGKLIGYESQILSETINIVHPIFNANYYIEYKYNNTLFRDILDANNRVQLRLERHGYLTCQFVAIDINSGNVIFKSNRWNFIVGSESSLEPSHYPCSSFMDDYHLNHHQCVYDIHHCNCDNKDESIDSYKAYHELLNELRNEEEIRFNETSKLNEDIIKIKQILNIDNPIASIIDANEIITTGEYQAGINSKHMPIENESGLSTQEFKLVIYKHNNTISQQAFEITTDTIWYRTGTIANTDVTWTEWKSNKTTI